MMDSPINLVNGPVKCFNNLFDDLNKLTVHHEIIDYLSRGAVS